MEIIPAGDDDMVEMQTLWFLHAEARYGEKGGFPAGPLIGYPTCVWIRYRHRHPVLDRLTLLELSNEALRATLSTTRAPPRLLVSDHRHRRERRESQHNKT